MKMKVAQIVEGIFEAMPMKERRRYLTEKMLNGYSSKVNWIEALSNTSFCDINFHLVYREYEQILHVDKENNETKTVTIAELTLVEDRIDFDQPKVKE